MSNISILIVDDDFNKITHVIKTIKEAYSDILSVMQASNVHEAIENLKEKEVHLLITDLQMPLKHDDQPIDEAGEVLIKTIYRKKNIVNVPMYIVGLTQFRELQSSYQGVWKVWHYDSGLLEWKYNLQDLIKHISLVKSRIYSNKIETIFLEGPSDKQVIKHALDMFFPTLSDSVSLETINYGGGASWVERQLFIWAKSLNKRQGEDDYIKAVGIFDDDNAGNKSVKKLYESIDSNSAEANTFSIIKNSHKYSHVLKSIRKKGILIPITLEELIDVNLWYYAKESGWLQRRSLSDIKIDTEVMQIDYKDLSKDVLLSHGFTEEECLIVMHKFIDDHKKSFIHYACSLDENVKSHALLSIKYLMIEVIRKLKLPFDR